jgi:xanthine/uracil permease
MGSQAASLLYLVVMVVVVVVVDWRFLRRHFWQRLAVNIGIVLAFLAVYWMFLRQP